MNIFIINIFSKHTQHPNLYYKYNFVAKQKKNLTHINHFTAHFLLIRPVKPVKFQNPLSRNRPSPPHNKNTHTHKCDNSSFNVEQYPIYANWPTRGEQTNSTPGRKSRARVCEIGAKIILKTSDPEKSRGLSVFLSRPRGGHQKHILHERSPPFLSQTRSRITVDIIL